LIVGEQLQSFKLHVSTIELPLVVLLEQHRADEALYRSLVGEDPDDIGSALYLSIEPLQRVRAVDLRSMRLRETQVREYAGSATAQRVGVDLSGVWTNDPEAATRAFQNDTFAADLPQFTDWGRERYDAAQPSRGPRGVSVTETEDPVYACFPPGMPRIYLHPFPVEIIQTPARIARTWRRPGWAIRSAAGTATRSSSSRPISTTAPGSIAPACRTANRCE
jgi:hypothetical protein